MPADYKKKVKKDSALQDPFYCAILNQNVCKGRQKFTYVDEKGDSAYQMQKNYGL